MKRKIFRFLIILLISFSVILAFPQFVTSQQEDVSEVGLSKVENWKLSIGPKEECSKDSLKYKQIKIGNKSLFCLQDIADLPPEDSPKYWKEHAEKLEQKAKEFSRKLTNFADTSISVEKLEKSETIFPLRNKIYQEKINNKNEKKVVEKTQRDGFYYVKIFYTTTNKYFNKEYEHELIRIGVTSKLGDCRYEDEDNANIKKVTEDNIKDCLNNKANTYLKEIQDNIREHRNNYLLKPQDTKKPQDTNSQDKQVGLSSQAVTVKGNKIFYIRTWYNGLSPQERAKRASTIIEKIVDNEIDIQDIGIFSESSQNNNLTNNNDTSSEEQETSKVIKIISDSPLLTEQDKLIIQININDARLEEKDSTEVLAKERLDKITKVIAKYRSDVRKKGFSDQIGNYIRLNDKKFFYLKPDPEPDVYNSSYRANLISRKVDKIADKWSFDKDALMAGYWITDELENSQKVCILADSFVANLIVNPNESESKDTEWEAYIEKKYRYGKDLKTKIHDATSLDSRDTKTDCTIQYIENNDAILKIIYSPEILEKIKKKNQDNHIKFIKVENENPQTKTNTLTNTLIEVSWNKKYEEEHNNNPKMFEQIMQIKQHEPDLINFPSSNMEDIAMKFISDTRKEINEYRRTRDTIKKIIIIIIPSIVLLSIVIIVKYFKSIKNMIIKILNTPGVKILKLVGFTLLIYIFLVSVISDILFQLFLYISKVFLGINPDKINGYFLDDLIEFVLTNPSILFISFIFSCMLLTFVTAKNKSKKDSITNYFKYIYYLLFLIAILSTISVNLGLSFVQFDQIIRAKQTVVLVFLNEQFSKIGLYIKNEIPHIIFITFIAFVIYQFLDFIINLSHSKILFIKAFDKTIINSILQIFYFLIVVGSVILMWPHFPGAGTIYFNAFIGFIILILGWSGSSIISDVIAGIILIFGDSAHEGDWIQIQEVFGQIKQQNLLVHRIKTPKNTVITIPNSTILKELTTNFGGSNNRDKKTDNNEIADKINKTDTEQKTKDNNDDKLILYTSVGLGYNTPRCEVEKVLIQAAKNTATTRKNVLCEPCPFVLLTNLGDFAITYELNVYIDTEEDIPLIYSDLHKNIQDECNKAGIEILSPNYLAIRDGNDSTIPKSLIKTSKS